MNLTKHLDVSHIKKNPALFLRSHHEDKTHSTTSLTVRKFVLTLKHTYPSPSLGNSNMQQVNFDDSILLRPAPPPPTNRSNFEPDRDTGRFELIRDDNEFFMPVKSVDFSFKTIHEEFGQPILLAMKERKALKESADKPLIQF